jgi:DNA primase
LAAEFYHHYLLKNTEAKRAREYLAKRGIGKDTIVTYLLGYAPSNQTTLTKILEQKGVDLSMAVEAGLVLEKERAKVYDRFWHRIMFPIFDVKGNIIPQKHLSIKKDLAFMVSMWLNNGVKNKKRFY